MTQPQGRADALVIGGGIVGCSVAWGLVRRGLAVTILDEGDVAIRASRGNFGLVWVQGKGLGFPAYSHLTLDAAEAWPAFAGELTAASGIDPMFQPGGGYGFCFTEADLEARAEAMARMAAQTQGRFRYRMLDRAALVDRLPWIGPDVAGAVFTPQGGGANPLLLLRGLQAALKRAGAVFHSSDRAESIAADDGGFAVATASGRRHRGARIVLAAGLGNRALAPMVGLSAPVRPIRGQILVTARVAPFLDVATSVMRQMPEGTCLVGDTMEDAGFDPGVLSASVAGLAARAVRVNPALEHVGLVRAWGALRIMSPDGVPIYDRAAEAPAWLVTVHSGVTLAPVHAALIGGAIAGDTMPERLAPFSGARFATGGMPSQITSH